MKSLLKNIIAMLTMGILVVACSDNDDSTTISPNGSTNIRVLHTSYDAPEVDIWVDGSTAITDLGYGESSGYATLETGDINVQVTLTGATTPVIIDADLELMEDQEYTIIAAGSFFNNDLRQ